MTQDEVRPFVGKCVAVTLDTGDVFQGFLREEDDAYKVDAGSSMTSIDASEQIDHIDLLTM